MDGLPRTLKEWLIGVVVAAGFLVVAVPAWLLFVGPIAAWGWGSIALIALQIIINAGPGQRKVEAPPPVRRRPPGDGAEFSGMAYNSPPDPAWNTAPFWDQRYAEIIPQTAGLAVPGPGFFRILRETVAARSGGVDLWMFDQGLHRDCNRVADILAAHGAMPDRDGQGGGHADGSAAPRRILDAGCGISLLPHVLAYWGFQVTAIDISPRAIAFASALAPEETDLARCIDVFDPYTGSNDLMRKHARVLVKDPARSLAGLRAHRAATPGTITWIAGDWLTAVPAGVFDVIHCRGGLRNAPKPYWIAALARFHALLAPGGLLLLEHQNAIGIQDEVEALFAPAGFLHLKGDMVRDRERRCVVARWPTG
jgi:SAM-dependent methyltransferase